MTKHLIILTGPTAVGKTALSIDLAQQLDTVILSCDSRQFYKEMSIGTAKPTKEELAQVKHHFINHCSIEQHYSVGDYEKEVIQLLDKLFQTKDQVIMVGGSGLFIKAVCEGLDTFPTIDPKVRQQLDKTYQEKGLSYIQAQLAQLDPVYFEQVDQKNPQRILRALEVCISAQKPYSSFRSQQKKQRSFNPIHIALTRDREKLYERINLRVDQMLEMGLLEEVKHLYDFKHLNALQTVGYSELFDYLDHKHSFEEAVRLIKRNTRRYAKRQLTWIRRQENVYPMNANQPNKVIDFIKNIVLYQKPM